MESRDFCFGSGVFGSPKRKYCKLPGAGCGVAWSERARSAEADPGGKQGNSHRFIKGHKDVPTSVRAMKAGAVEFLVKPFSERDLLDAIQQAIIRDQSARHQQAHRVSVEPI